MKTLKRCKEWWRIYRLLGRRHEEMSPEVRDLYEIDMALQYIRPADKNLWPESERGEK